MTFQLLTIETAMTIEDEAARLRAHVQSVPCNLNKLLDICQDWSDSILTSPACQIPGAVFLSMWLRRNTLESILKREFGRSFLKEPWRKEGRTFVRPFPLGVIGHWPAANVEILPFLSMLCSLLGGNGALVRIPSEFVSLVPPLMESLEKSDRTGYLTNRISLVTFPHEDETLLEVFAKNVDGAMIWGGEEATCKVRALPFPHWAHIRIFGPRISLAMMDKESWTSGTKRKLWCTRLAREVWQFDQAACTSPQILFVEHAPDIPIDVLLESLSVAFAQENRLHPRLTIEPSLTSAIVKARSNCLFENLSNKAIFPSNPDWSILLLNDLKIPEITLGKVLNVVPVEHLEEAVELLDRDVQTLGVAIEDRERERKLAERAGFRGIDKIVRIGMMHVFCSPWDGGDIISPMVRLVRYAPSQ